MIRIGTRRSELALWQARHVAARLSAAHPGLNYELVEIESSGDLDLASPLQQLGTVGIFTKTLELALLDGRIDLAVHSCKDVPSAIEAGTRLLAVGEREDARDILFARGISSLEELPRGSVVATGSLRRRSQLLNLRPDLQMVGLRGNLQTRWEKYERRSFDAMLLAAAGVDRLGWKDRVGLRLPVDLMLPAVGQGVLAVQFREEWKEAPRLDSLVHEPTRLAVLAERQMMATVGGGCIVPLAGYATLFEGTLRLEARIGTPDGKTLLRAEAEAEATEAESLGEEVARALLEQGAARIVADARRDPKSDADLA